MFFLDSGEMVLPLWFSWVKNIFVSELGQVCRMCKSDFNRTTVNLWRLGYLVSIKNEILKYEIKWRNKFHNKQNKKPNCR